MSPEKNGASKVSINFNLNLIETRGGVVPGRDSHFTEDQNSSQNSSLDYEEPIPH